MVRYRNLWTAACIAIVVGIGLLATLFSRWQGELNAHSALELVATLLASFVALAAISRYLARKEPLLLFVGVGFFGAALFDGQHLVLTSQWWLESLSPETQWSWNPARTFLAMQLLFGCWACARDWRSEVQEHPNNAVYVRLAVLTLVSFVIAAFAPFPRRYVADYWLGRPDELASGVVFAVALFGFLALVDRKPTALLQWLTVAVAISCAGQILVMSRSTQLFDGYFMLGHIIKIASYACVLIGLIADFYWLSTDAQRAEQAYRDQAARTQSILDGATDAIITISAGGVVESYNRAAEQMFGYSPDQVIGENVTLLMPSPYREEHDQYLRNYLATGVARIIGIGREVVGRRADGSTFPMHLAVSEVKLGRRRLFTGIVRDITDIKQAMDQICSANNELARRSRQIERFNLDLKRSNDELRQFAYVASHDLQEPLRKVAAFCQMLDDEYADRLDEEGQRYIRYAVDGSIRMKALIQDLLTYSRVETQGKPLEPTEAAGACAEAVENLSLTIQEAGAQVACDPLPTIVADRAQLVRLFQNLIGNAIKYRGPDPPQVHVSASERDGSWEFRIRDNGLGIDPQYHERIFVIFQRLHAREEYSGTGIGLAVCKRIVERAGGTIWVESAVGAGSTFCFTFMSPQSSSPHGEANHDRLAAECLTATD
jgi:PAS domain S-box-containing protein